MSYLNQFSVPVSSPGYFSTLQGKSYLTPNITNAGKTSIYALAGGGGGGTVYYDNIFTSSLTSFSTVQSVKLSANIGIFDTITSLSSITVNATDGNLNVIGGINLDGNVLTTASGPGAELLLNGIPIATTANISSITDWSLYPAISTVSFGSTNDGRLINVSTINGVAFVNGGGVSSDWSQYPAIQNVNMQNFDLLSTNSLVFNPSGNMAIVGLSTVNGVAYPPGGGGNVSTIAGIDTFMTASGFGSGGFNTSAISGSGGLGGFVTLDANAGDAGVNNGRVVITANGGTAPGGLFGRVDIIANSGVSDPGTGPVTTGGYVNIQANSGAIVSPTATSRIDLNAGGLNLYAGIASPITSVEGYAFINAVNGVSLVAGTWTSAFQTPGTVYLYGNNGVVMGSDMYATDIYAEWNGLAPPANLSINGRTTISGNAYVELNNVSTINFEVGQAGAITGLSTINGVAYPPASGGVTSLNSIAGAVNLLAGTDILVSNASPTAQDITIDVINVLPYTLTGTKGGGVIVNRPIGSGNPFPSNTFTVATTITFNIPAGLTATDGVFYDGYILYDFSSNFNSFWGVSYYTNTFPTPTDILGSTTTTANALNFTNIQQIYLPLNLLIPNTNIVAGGTITLQVYCNPTSINHYITLTPVITARIGRVDD